MNYDHWKTTDPEDREYCRCGVHASDCLMDQFGDCPVEDQEMEEQAMAEASPSLSHLIDNARRHLKDARERIQDLPAQIDMSRMRVTLDMLDGDLNAMMQHVSKVRSRL